MSILPISFSNSPMRILNGGIGMNTMIISALSLYALSNLPVVSAHSVMAERCIEICSKTINVAAQTVCFFGCIAVDLAKLISKNG